MSKWISVKENGNTRMVDIEKVIHKSPVMIYEHESEDRQNTCPLNTKVGELHGVGMVDDTPYNNAR